jgi:hypothetical protein
LARYARAIERRWGDFLGRPAVLSPSDWRRVSDWHDRGIPLQLIVECIEAAEERRREGRGARRARSLAYLASAVEESWSVLREGRIVPVEDGRAPTLREPLECWRRRLEREPRGSELGQLLQRLLAELSAGAEEQQIDRQLDRALDAVVPAELRQAAEEEARSWLDAHRSRLSPDELERAVQRAARIGLRRRLGLPRLTRS